MDWLIGPCFFRKDGIFYYKSEGHGFIPIHINIYQRLPANIIPELFQHNKCSQICHVCIAGAYLLIYGNLIPVLLMIFTGLLVICRINTKIGLGVSSNKRHYSFRGFEPQWQNDLGLEK